MQVNYFSNIPKEKLIKFTGDKIPWLKGELLFSSVGPLTLIYMHWLCFQVTCTIFWLNISFRVHLDLYVPDFPKSTSKYLLFTKDVRKHGSRCFTAMYHFWIPCFLNDYSELLNHVIFSKLILQMNFWLNFSSFVAKTV